MKRAVSFFFLLACCGFLLGDTPASLLEDLVRLTKAGFSEETVLDYAKAHRVELPSVVSADDLLWLRKSGVSETVVRYMTAIDVRASDGGGQEDVAYDSASAAGYERYSPAYSYPDDLAYGYPDSGDFGGYPATYYADYYPFFGAGYYPYPAYFFLNSSGFFGRFHGRHRGFDRRRGEGVHRGGFGRPGSSRGFGGRHGGMIADHRGAGLPAFPRRSLAPGPGRTRGAMMGHGASRGPAFSRGGSGPGLRGPQGGAGRGAFGHPGFAGGGGRAGGGPSPRSGGGPGPGGRGRR